MLIRFLKHTGAARKGQEADPDARRAIAYLLGKVVLKPKAAGGPKVPTPPRYPSAPSVGRGLAGQPDLRCPALPAPLCLGGDRLRRRRHRHRGLESGLTTHR